MSFNRKHVAYLNELDIPVWVARSQNLPTDNAEQVSSVAVQKNRTEADLKKGSIERLSVLSKRVKACVSCALFESRKMPVFGVGDPHARLMLIGEFPVFEDEKSGEPFAGRAGDLLTLMLKSIGLDRPEVYLSNLVSCRPPDNRKPRPEELLACHEYLKRQVGIVKPELLVLIGKQVAEYCLNLTANMDSLRGKIHDSQSLGIPAIVTYHPAYLLTTPADKRKAWDDLKMVRSFLGLD